MDSMRKPASVATLALVAALMVGCDDDPTETVEIITPADGDVVNLPFEATFSSSVTLGTSAAGLHHLHVWFGGDEDAYQVVEGNVTEITIAPPGEQVMHASLRNPDHSETGVETSITIVIDSTTD
jgi:hypothetical protein